MAINLSRLWQYKVGLAFFTFTIILVIFYFYQKNTFILATQQDFSDELVITPPEAHVIKQDFSAHSIKQDAVKKSFQDYLDNVPDYLQGTEFRGALLVDELGKLRITSQIKKRFDYFYLLSGDKTPAQIEDIIIGHLFTTLTEPALQMALDLLKNYSNYTKEYQILIENLTPQDAQSDLLWLAQEINDLKSNIFGKEIADIFFGSEDSIRQESLRLMAINNANPDQLHIPHDDLDDLPRDIIENREKTLRFYTAKQEIQRALDTGIDAQALSQLRTKLYGEKAAQRLKRVDKNRQNWAIIVAEYQHRKSNLKQNGGLSDTDITTALEGQMRQSHQLSTIQLRRLAAQERIAKNNN